VRGFMEGQGRVEDDGAVYEGQFKRGDMHGKGKLTREEHQFVYEGQFVHNRMEGTGKLTVGDTVYEGQFKNDKPSGHVRMTDGHGTIIEGQFDGDQHVGVVVITWPKRNMRYEGLQKDMWPDGEGALTRADKAVVRGTFKYFNVKGEATITYPDGAIYTGPVDHYRAQGQGELRRPNGDVYRGRFAADQFDGKGRLTLADGTVQTGYWRAGQYQGAQGDDAPEDTPELAASNNEATLYNQQELLRQQFDQLKPSPAGGPARMYALLVAGDGRQEVFRREVTYVGDLLARRFGAGGQTVRLVNSRGSARQLPLATAHSIGLALQALAQKMNRERDLLFVFLTSHGSPTHELALGMGSMDLPNLPAARLRELLDASGIRNKVVVVSACYSGGFIPALQGERTWVITASRADRTSFGCADENDFTRFGHALFKESLTGAPTLSAAFERAAAQVREWEQQEAEQHKNAAADAKAAPPPPQPGEDEDDEDEGDEAGEAQASEPQSAVSPAFRAEVDAWFAAHPPVGK